MDTESLKGIGSLLLWGGLFFVMMRFGCGAHMMGGHGHGHHGGSADSDGDTKDPVCGMSVDRDKSTAASVYRGKTYSFCSTTCRDKFEQTPEKYIGVSAQNETQQGGHHHG
ncbi:MAG: YHS domain-containing protein [Betaproteobacteria bacterium]